mmetsp:Transcript_12122/g.17983  ORF Transcript_12122/g.17983 Transcript_12122/m.17983 type:complete len:261 (-) Transcript_12122:69-851(-)
MHAMKQTMDKDTWCPNHQNVVGVIGGMGPGATVKLFQYVVELQKATSDEDHVPLLIYNNPQIPNNNKAVLQTGPSSVPAMGYTARALERAGATHLAIPCNTAHCFLSELAEWTNLPILDMIDLTIRSVFDMQVSRIGLLATDGTVKIGLYQKVIKKISKEFNTRPIGMIVPNAKGQCEVDDCILRIKSGDVGADVQRRLLIEAQSLTSRGADIIITGCTELPLVLSDELLSFCVKFVDPMRILALEIIRITGKICEMNQR